MKSRINNIDDLRSEILRLKLERFQQEAVLEQDVKRIIDKFKAPFRLINKVTAFFGKGKGTDHDGHASHENEHHPDWLTNVLRVGLPVVLNKLVFRNSGFIMKSLVTILSQKAAKNVNKDSVSGLIDKGADFIRNFKNKKALKRLHADYGIPPDSETY
ncbi:MAG: hypothetical protein JWN56_2643 [Sphingobacteriales bacterium]|nr:hypothetical protein [Sphingobacteriales bacterium]